MLGLSMTWNSDKPAKTNPGKGFYIVQMNVISKTSELL